MVLIRCVIAKWINQTHPSVVRPGSNSGFTLLIRMRELPWVCPNILFEFLRVVKECFVRETVFDGRAITASVYRNIDSFHYHALILTDTFLQHTSDRYMYWHQAVQRNYSLNGESLPVYRRCVFVRECIGLDLHQLSNNIHVR